MAISDSDEGVKMDENKMITENIPHELRSMTSEDLKRYFVEIITKAWDRSQYWQTELERAQIEVINLENQVAELKQQLMPEFSPEMRPLLDFDCTAQTWDALLDLIHGLWRHDYGTMVVYLQTQCLYLATGGWSDNEEIIMALQHNPLLWSLTWQSSQRGGAYYFDGSRYPHKEKPVQ